MLYEVITTHGLPTGLDGKVFAGALPGSAALIDLMATDKKVKDGRITSYNVCYTKLLRPSMGRRPAARAAITMREIG